MFPLPIADTTRVRYQTVPWMTFGLILLNIAVWYYTDVYALENVVFSSPYGPVSGLSISFLVYGTVPYTIQTQQGIGALSVLTATFLHAPGFFCGVPFSWHLFGNMIFLWAFGRRIEDACGPFRFLLFYLLAGLIAGLTSILIRGGDPIDRLRPGIGASGAIAGVMGAFLILFPGTRITTIPMIGFLPIPIRFRIPALVYLGWWLLLQLIPAFQFAQGDLDFYTTDFFAHLGGFFSGLLVFLFVRKDLLYRYISGTKL